MPAPTTIRKVTLLTKSRRKSPPAFDITISPEGIAVLHPGQAARQLDWSRVATWEIEPRRRRVLLVLRGDGSVTPLLIPGWTVDDLDQLLRDMTAHLTPARLGPEPGSASDIVDGPELGDGLVHPGLDLELPAPTKSGLTQDLGDMDLSLPAPAPAAAPDPADAGGAMDLTLSSAPPVPDPADTALAPDEDGAVDGEAGDAD